MDPLLDFLNEHIGRRRALRRTLGGVALLGGATLLPTGCAGYPKAPAGLRTFSAKEFHILQTAMDTVLPKRGAEELSVAEAGSAEHFDALVVGAPSEVVDALKQLLLLVEHGTILDGKLTRFTSLERADREAYLRGWMRSDRAFFKQAFVAIRKISIASYYANDETWKHIKYDGPMKTRSGAPGPLGISSIAGGNPSSAQPGPERIGAAS